MAFKKRVYGGKKKQFRKKRAAPIKRAVRKAKTRMFNKRVLRAVSRATETKVVSWRQSQVGIPALTSSTAEQTIFLISPGTNGSLPTYQINQGTGQGERVGNKIAPTYVTVKGVIRPNPLFEVTANYNPCPMYVVLWVVSLTKSQHDDLLTLESVIANSFFQNGNTSLGMTGQLIDLTQTVNTTHITVHNKRVMKLGMADYSSAFAANSANNNAQRFANNDFNMSKMFSMRLKFPKTMQWNDASPAPTNMRRWWMFAVPYRVDGQVFATSGGNATGPIPLILDFGLDFRFKDS